jgi:hypothetical protein
VCEILSGLYKAFIQPQLWTSLIASAIHLLLLRTPVKRRRAKVGVMWLDGWPGLQHPFSLTTTQKQQHHWRVKQMDKIDMKILEAINTISTKSFVSSVKVNEILRLNATELGDRLKSLKKSGHVDITTSDYPSSLTLPNSISKVYLTELGRRSLKQKR